MVPSCLPYVCFLVTLAGARTSIISTSSGSWVGVGRGEQRGFDWFPQRPSAGGPTGFAAAALCQIVCLLPSRVFRDGRRRRISFWPRTVTVRANVSQLTRDLHFEPVTSRAAPQTRQRQIEPHDYARRWAVGFRQWRAVFLPMGTIYDLLIYISAHGQTAKPGSPASALRSWHGRPLYPPRSDSPPRRNTVAALPEAAFSSP